MTLETRRGLDAQKKPPFNYRANPDLLKRLRDFADQLDRPAASLIDEAVKLFLDRQKEEANDASPEQSDVIVKNPVKAERLVKNPAKAERHGTPTRYYAGCRCPECTRANTKRCYEYRGKRRQQSNREIEHGTLAAYQYDICRCPECKAAKAVANAADENKVAEQDYTLADLTTKDLDSLESAWLDIREGLTVSGKCQSEADLISIKKWGRSHEPRITVRREHNLD